MKSSKKLQISSHLLFVYIDNQDRKWRMSVLVFSRALPTYILTYEISSNVTTLIRYHLKFFFEHDASAAWSKSSELLVICIKGKP